MLDRMGHSVVEAGNGEQGVRNYQSDRPGLVLIDVVMPVMDGYEAAQRMRQSSQEEWVPIIFLSSKEADQDLDKAIEAGGDDYLVKPVSFVVLNAKIRALHRIETMRNRLLEVSHELATANRELQKLSRQDGLTGIANRRYFDSYLQNELRRAARDHCPVSLILSDVDYFKSFNDCYGHHAGDGCLKQVAAALSSVGRRPADLAARYGGEEFAMILPSTAVDGAIDVAKSVSRVVAGLAITHTRSEVGQTVTLSQGIVSIVPEKNTTPEDLILRADQALYRAKELGRDRYIVFAAGDR